MTTLVKGLAAFSVIAAMMGTPSASAASCKARKGARSTKAYCNYGAPVRVGDLVLVPRACRLPLKSGPLLRHTVELLAADTGKRVGQVSTPPTPTKSADKPAAGALIAGPYPIYVWSGGIAAVDVRGRRLQVVFEPTGALAGVARHGELLAVVDALKPSLQYPKGSLEWTIIDFGAGAVRGQRTLGKGSVEDLGFTVRNKQLNAWLVVRGKGAAARVTAPLTTAAGKPLPAGILKVKLKQVKGAIRSAGSGLSSGKGSGCPVVTGLDAARPARPWVSLGRDGSGSAPTSARKMVTLPGCRVATPKGPKGIVWAWIKGERGLALQSFDCAPAKPTK